MVPICLAAVEIGIGAEVPAGLQHVPHAEAEIALGAVIVVHAGAQAAEQQGVAVLGQRYEQIRLAEAALRPALALKVDMRRPFRGGGFGGMSLAGGEQRCGEAHADDSCQTAIPAIRPIRLYTHPNPAPPTTAHVAAASYFSLSVARAQAHEIGIESCRGRVCPYL